MNNAMVIFLSLAAAWSLQLVLAGMQSTRFHRRLQELKRDGVRTAVGVSGTKIKGKIYVVLVTDADGKILKAERLSGWTVFSRLKSIPQLIGKNVRDVSTRLEPSLKKKLALSAQNAAGYIVSALDGETRVPDANKHFGIK